METSNKAKFWIVVAFWLVGPILIMTCGCEPPNPKQPKVARRLYPDISAGSINTPEHGTNGITWQSLPYGSYPDGGSTNHPKIALWVSMKDIVGDPAPGGATVDCYIERGRTTCSASKFSVPSIEISPSKVRTNPSGTAIAYCSSDTSSLASMAYYAMYFKFHPGTPMYHGSVVESQFARRGANVPYATWSPQNGEEGEFWDSVSFGGNGCKTLAQAGGGISRALMKDIAATSSESLFLSSEPNIMPPNIVVKFYIAEWYMARLNENGYFLSPVQQFDTIQDIDPNNIRDNTSPYCMSYCFQTTEPIVLAGLTLNVSLKIVDANSVVTGQAPINVTVTADNGVRHVARSQYVVLADPNNYQPFMVATEGGPILVVPCREGDTVKIETTDMWNR